MMDQSELTHWACWILKDCLYERKRAYAIFLANLYILNTTIFLKGKSFLTCIILINDALAVDQ